MEIIKPIKILYVNGGLLDFGGVTSVMLNYYHCFDSNRIHIDFLVHGFEDGPRDQEVLNNGSQIYHVIPKHKNPIKSYLQIKHIIKNGHFDIVHSHADSGNGFILRIAKKCGVKVRISHSHNTDYTTNNKFRIWLNNIQKKFIGKYATELWACSKLAGEWLYGKNTKFDIIPNAIEFGKYLFNQETRDKLRKEFDIENNYVIGHIGKFDIQKNQLFLLKVFSDIVKINQNFRLVLVGDGLDRIKIESAINEFKINDYVILLGRREDVPDILNTFDIFVLPSLFEGLPMVAVEAQANGLKCICSNHVPSECNITGNVDFLPLNQNDWVESLLKKKTRPGCSIDIGIKAGFEIESSAKNLEKRYEDLAK